jgi:flagellar basal-body rod protein FlgC
MTSVFSIAASGMMASQRRLEVAARNVANMSSTGPLDRAGAGGAAAAYAALRVEQVATSGGGTQAVVSTVSPGTVRAYAPDAPYADENGMVAAPNVSLETEIMQAMMARYTFAANAVVLRTAADMQKTLVDAVG